MRRATETMASIRLPLACIREFIESHPLFVLTEANIHSVYDVIVAILTHEKVVQEEATKKASQQHLSSETHPRRAQFVCPSCKGERYYVDTKDANLICRACGTCTRWIDASLREYEKPVDLAGKAPGRCSHAFTQEERKQHDIENELQKWVLNPYARVPMDKVAYDRAVRRASVPLRANITDRVVGAILTHCIAEKLDLDDIERRMQANNGLPVLRYEEKVPEYACQKCGAAVWTLWETRRHPCGWGMKKRKR